MLAKSETRQSVSPAWLRSGHQVEQLLGPAFQVQAGVLLGLAARDRIDPLHDIEHALRLAPFLGQDRLDDFSGFAA